MVILDIDIPTKCMNCPLLGRDSMYCQIYPRKDLDLIDVVNGKPEWCPIVLDIKDIKAEIKAKANEHIFYTDCGRIEDGLYEALKIIDKHLAENERKK